MAELARLPIDHVDPTGVAILLGPDDPSSTGANALIGSGYINRATGQWYYKTTSADTGWTAFGAGGGFLTTTTADARYAFIGGSNATGTWPIGISGNAATVTQGVYKNVTNVFSAFQEVAYGTTADWAIATRIGTDTTGRRFVLLVTGEQRWGPGGTAASDVQLLRSGVGVLQVAGSLNATVNLSEAGTTLSAKYALVGGSNATGTWGISISGTAANATNAANVPWSGTSSGRPTTIGGYGITDFNSLGDARWLKLDASNVPLTGRLNIHKDADGLLLFPITTAASAYITFYDSLGTTRRGYVGFGGGTAASNDLYITCDGGGITFELASSARARFDTSGLVITANQSVSTSTPARLSMGDSFSNSTGLASRSKIKTYDAGGETVYGIGVSSSNFEFHAFGADYTWYVSNVSKMKLTSAGVLSVQGQQVATISYGSTAPTSSTPGIAGQLYGVT